jgi:hypothetical protein
VQDPGGEGNDRVRAGEVQTKLKLQIPSTKLQRNFNYQVPNAAVRRRLLEFEVWSFSGVGTLVLGATLNCHRHHAGYGIFCRN